MKNIILLSFIIQVLLMTAVTGAPKVEVKGKTRIDFGNYPAKDMKKALFTIVNKGDKLLKIVNIRKTCGCSEANTDKKELKPGEETILKAVIKENSIHGPFSKNIYVETNDPKQRFLSLTLAGKAIPLLTIKPKDKIYAGRLTLGKEWKQAFLLEGTEDGIELGKPEINSSYPVDVSLKKQDGNKFRLEMSFLPKEVKGDLKLKVKIPVVKPEGWRPLQISVNGKVGMTLQVIPSRLTIPVASNAKLVRKFQLRLLGGNNKLDSKLISYQKVKGLELSLGKPIRNAIPVTASFSGEYLKEIQKNKNSSLILTYPGSSKAIIFIQTNN